MFYPQEMTEIEIIVPERDALVVTRELAEQGVFHQVDANQLRSEMPFVAADHWREQSIAYSELEHRIVAVMKTLDIEEGGPPSPDQISIVEVDTARKLVAQREQQSQRLFEEMVDERKKLEQLEAYIRQLEPLVDLGIEINALRDLRYTFVILGMMPTENIRRLQTSLARVPFVLLPLHPQGAQTVVLLMGAERDADVLERAARSAYLNPMDLPEAYRGTPAEIIETIHADMDQVRQQITGQTATMCELHEICEQQLQELLWCVRAGRMVADAIVSFGRLHYTYVVVGWVPTSRLAPLVSRLKQVSDGAYIETNTPKRSHKDSDVPVALNNPGILRSFQQLVTNYAWPRYGEIDPTFLLMLTFPLLFGMMFGDVGHGLVLVLLGALVASGKVRALRTLASLGVTLIACGLVAIVFGFLYGSIFGMESVLPALWLRPPESILEILTTAIGFGSILLTLGFVISIINAWTARDWGWMFFANNGLAGLLFYWSLVGLAAEAFLKRFFVPPLVLGVLAALAGLAIMLSEMLRRLFEGQRPLFETGVGSYVVLAFFELFETGISFLSNSLSYVRVGAFAVAHGGLSAVVFILAELVGPSQAPGYWIVVTLGNIFVIGFEGLIVGIQTMRLEYYEFFSKFFRGGGKRYAPLTLVPKTKE
jgi:V/A-type H+-transporting ATPase subunit I